MSNIEKLGGAEDEAKLYSIDAFCNKISEFAGHSSVSLSWTFSYMYPISNGSVVEVELNVNNSVSEILVHLDFGAARMVCTRPSPLSKRTWG